ncbi:MAG: polysaccharide deacetylase family protein [Parvularculaceae bacterium]
MTGGMIPILTFHSISDADGPTSIPRSVFAMQMREIAETGVEVVALDKVQAFMKGEWSPEKPSLAITFDDAFQDFADNAHSVLGCHAYPSCVFAPTQKLGGAEDWYGSNESARKLMDWNTIEELSRNGVTIGSHSKSHHDLTKLDDDALAEDLAASRKTLEDKLGKSVPFFAPPYGRSDERVRRAIAKQYDLSVGVRLARATRHSPLFDLPRIEMHYFRDARIWRRFLQGRGETYFRARQAARGIRGAAASLLQSSKA